MLTIRLGDTEHDPVHWRVDAKNDDESKYGILSSVSEINKLNIYLKNAVKVLVSSRKIIFRKLKITNTKVIRSIRSISFAIEKSIADDIDKFHVSILKYDEEFLHVAIVEHELMELWLYWLKKNGVIIKSLTPDVLILPFINGEWSAVKIDKEWIVRNNEVSGFLVSDELFEKIYSSWYSSTLVNIMNDCDIKNVNWRVIRNKDPLHFMAKDIQGCNSSLLTGKYKFHDGTVITHRYISRVTGWGVLLSLIICLNTWHDGYKIAQAIDILDVHSNFYYRKFPIVNEKNASGDLSYNESSADFINLLSYLLSYFDDKDLDIVSFHFSKEDKAIFFDVDRVEPGMKMDLPGWTGNENERIKISQSYNESGKDRVIFKYP
ncbi:general secretion pathway protein L [Yersinia aldovae]|uniref:type II secretion system protein GspL n=1 Tax=Yersinia aldovae TaxID=29483 RepID=UPI0005DA6980|nr:type II secretion system protein GspL [Yersinia aldovae]CNI12318.1 general secretion pathway protein L [Yersinia aldovae]